MSTESRCCRSLRRKSLLCPRRVAPFNDRLTRVRLSHQSNSAEYRGRLAPSPTGLLHLGHARTFWIGAQRAAECGGTLILRNEDLDPKRCRAEFVASIV